MTLDMLPLGQEAVITSVAVSYTHLAVYKRQDTGRGPFHFRDAPGCGTA